MHKINTFQLIQFQTYSTRNQGRAMLLQLHGHPCAGLLNQQKILGTSGPSEPDCLAKQCRAMANMQSDASWKNTRQAAAATIELLSLLKESDEIEIQRQQLTKKVDTLRAALKVSPAMSPDSQARVSSKGLVDPCLGRYWTMSGQ